MKRPSLLEGILVALVCSLVVSPLAVVLQILYGSMLAWKAVIVVLTCLYVGYLLVQSDKRQGRITLGLLAPALLLGGLLCGLQTSTLLILSIGLIWCIRSFAYSRSLLSVLLQGVVCALGCGAMFTVYSSSRSPGLALWSFLLVQATFVWIPAQLSRRSTATPSAAPGSPADGFTRAYQAAEHALRRLEARTAR